MGSFSFGALPLRCRLFRGNLSRPQPAASQQATRQSVHPKEQSPFQRVLLAEQLRNISIQRHQGQAVEATLCEQAAMRATAEGAVDTAASLQAAIAKALAADARRGAFRQAAIAEALNTDSAQERKEKILKQSLSQQHQQQISELQQQQQAELQQIQADCEARLRQQQAAHETTLMERAAQHEAQLQHSSCTHGKQVAQLNSMHTEVLAAAHIQSKIDLEQQQQTLSHQHQAHLQSVQAEKDAFIARSQAEHASDLASVTANYSAVLAEVQESNRAFLIQRSAVQASEHASQMASLQSEHEAQQADAARQSQAALAQLRHEYEQSMRQQLSAKDSDISVVQSNLQSANADVAALTRDVAHLQLLAEQHQLQLKTQVNAEQVFEQQAQQLREQLDVAASQLDSLTTQVTTHKAAYESEHACVEE